MPLPLLETTDPVFVKRLSKEIGRRCFMDGFTSDFASDSGERRYSGRVAVRKGRLIARLAGGGEVDLTGVEAVKTLRSMVTVSRRPEPGA